MLDVGGIHFFPSAGSEEIGDCAVVFGSVGKSLLHQLEAGVKAKCSFVIGKLIDDIAVGLGFDKLELDDGLIQNALNPAENVKIRRVVGGPAPEMVEIARDNIKIFLNEEFEKKGI